MRLRAGTSGFSYKAWKGPFYPEGLADRALLEFYARHLPTVEINNTFYRMPKPGTLAGWATQVPHGFVFAIKASQRITHRARLKDAGAPVAYLWSCVAALGEHRGPILFQLPPNFKKDVERLEAFVGALPEGMRAVFEFRHDSWTDPEVSQILERHGVARCVADTDDGEPPALAATTDWGYLRLRRETYGDAQLGEWVERIRSQPWREVFVFFKHEDGGTAPRLARRFTELFER